MKEQLDTNGNYIQNQFCSYEIALKLKELGFDEECLGLFKEDKSFLFCDVFAFRESYTESEFKDNLCCDLYYKNSIILDNLVSAPIWQQVIDWFRERYNLHLIPIYSYNDILHWSYHIEDIVTGECYIPLIDDGLTLKSTKYEAREQAILKAIEIINGGNI